MAKTKADYVQDLFRSVFTMAMRPLLLRSRLSIANWIGVGSAGSGQGAVTARAMDEFGLMARLCGHTVSPISLPTAPFRTASLFATTAITRPAAVRRIYSWAPTQITLGTPS